MALPSPAVLVARFLRANNFENTLAAFLEEARLPPDAGVLSRGDLTIEQVLREKETFDLTVNFEKLGVDDDEKGWRRPAPSTATELAVLPTASNILNTSVEMLDSGDGSPEPIVLASTADRQLHMISPRGNGFEIRRSLTQVQDSPVLAHSVVGRRYLLVTSMSGKLVLYDCRGDLVLGERRDHSKYAVKVTTMERADGVWIATAGWDAKVFLYFAGGLSENSPRLQAPLATLTLPTNPEAMMFIDHPEMAKPVLLLTRRDSTFLYYYALPDPGVHDSADVPVALQLLGKQNLAPTSNAWVAFTPSSISPCPTDPSILAIATSAVPHMKLIIVRLLVPPADAVEAGSGSSSVRHISADSSIVQAPTANQRDFIALNQATQARAALATQERELAAILVQCSTLAPQTPYSTPALAWRPDGSGVWVNSDDGVVRGVEASTGKVVTNLKGHEAASKVRCLWAGKVGPLGEDGENDEEWVLSGGFDQKLIVWRIPSAEGGSS